MVHFEPLTTRPVVRMLLVVEDRVQRFQIVWVWIGPGIDVLSLDVDDHPIVPAAASPFSWQRNTRRLLESVFGQERTSERRGRDW